MVLICYQIGIFPFKKGYDARSTISVIKLGQVNELCAMYLSMFKKKLCTSESLLPGSFQGNIFKLFLQSSLEIFICEGYSGCM